jgi:hypothetical protein
MPPSSTVTRSAASARDSLPTTSFAMNPLHQFNLPCHMRSAWIRPLFFRCLGGSVYYYRWRVWKEHLQETQSGTGQIVTEFLNGISYAAPFNGIVAAAGHQIMEGRWVRDQSYDDSDLRYWLTGPGLEAQTVDSYAPDWADEYATGWSTPPGSRPRSPAPCPRSRPWSPR